MPDHMQINDELTVGGQPTESEIQKLAKDGFKSIVNFRAAGEDDQPLSPEEEQDKVVAAKMKYFHLPVSMKSMDDSKADKFRQQFESLPKPVFAHCKTGKRAGAMAMMHVAVENGMTGEQTMKQAQQMGFECDVPELEKFVKTYVDSHRA